MPMPVSATVNLQRDLVAGGALDGDRDDHLAALGELDGVADQVDEHLPQPAGIADECVRHVRPDVAGELEALCRARAGASRRTASSTVSRSVERHLLERSLPASIFEKSRMSLTRSSSASPDSLTVAGSRCCTGVSVVSSARSVMPMMAFIGVRISWLMFARNSLGPRRRLGATPGRSSSVTSCASRSACLLLFAPRGLHLASRTAAARLRARLASVTSRAVA